MVEDMAKEPVATRRRPSWFLAVLGAFLVVRGALQLEQRAVVRL
jgi:hypothetical protein